MILIDEMIKKPLVGFVENSMLNMFTDFNYNVWGARDNIAESPVTWGGGGVYTLIENIHKDVLLPLGVVLLTYFVYWEFYQRVIENNNGSDDFTPYDFFKIIVTIFLGITLLKNSLTITMSFFDVGKSLVDSATQSNIAAVNIDVDMSKIKEGLEKQGILTLIGLLIGFQISKLFFAILGILVWILIQIRMFQIFFYTALSAVPLSTFASREFRSVGFNYLKNLLAYSIQGVLIILAFSIYRTVLQNHLQTLTVIDSLDFVFKVIGIGVILVVMIRQSSVIAKSVVEAH